MKEAAVSSGHARLRNHCRLTGPTVIANFAHGRALQCRAEGLPNKRLQLAAMTSVKSCSAEAGLRDNFTAAAGCSVMMGRRGLREPQLKSKAVGRPDNYSGDMSVTVGKYVL